MAIKIPTTFVNYLKTKLKKCETYEIETKIFEIQNSEEYIKNFITKSNDEIIDFLVGYLTGKTNKQLLNNGGAVNYIFKEDYREIPSYKSNSEIIITPFKKNQEEYLSDDEISFELRDEDFYKEQNMLDLIQKSIKMDENEESLDFTLNNSQNELNIEESIENSDNNKLFQPSEQLE